MQDLVPPQLITLRSVQFCQPHVRHRYCLAESDEALYVGVIGTKLRCAGSFSVHSKRSFVPCWYN